MKSVVSFRRRHLTAIVLASTLLVTSCQPLVVANPPATAQGTPPPEETPIVAFTTDEELIHIDSAPISGGVAVTYQTELGNDQVLRPIDRVFQGADYSVMIDDSRYLELAFQIGCIEFMLVKPDSGVGPVSLVYRQPDVSAVITPTSWSEYSLFNRVDDTAEGDVGKAVVVVDPETVIDAPIPMVPAGACDTTVVGEELNRWSRDAALTASDLDRLLVAVKQADGSFERTLVMITPSGGATCSAAKTACERCISCGLEFACRTIVEWFC